MIKSEISTEKISNWIFFSVLLIYVIIQFLTRSSSGSLTSFSSMLQGSVAILGIVFLILKEILVHPKTIFELYNFLTIILVSTIIYFSGRVEFILVPWLLYSSRNIDLKKAIKLVFFLQILMFSTFLLLYTMNFLQNPASSTVLGAKAFGFKYHSYLPHMIFFDIVVFAFLKKSSLKIYEYILILALVYLVYKQTGETDAPAVLSVLFLVGYFLIQHVSIVRTLVKRKILIILTLLLPWMLSFFINLYNKGGEFGYTLNSLLSNRLVLGSSAIQNYGVHWGPDNDIVMFAYNYTSIIGAKYNYIDSGLLQYLLYFGIVASFFLFYWIIIAQKKTLQLNKIVVSFMIFIIGVHLFNDEQFLWLDINPALLLLSYAFRNEEIIGM